MRQTVSLPSGAGHQSPDGCKTRKTAACTSTSLHEYEQAQGDLGSKGHKLAPKIGEVFLDFLALLVLLVEHAARDLYSIPRNCQSAPDMRLASFRIVIRRVTTQRKAWGKPAGRKIDKRHITFPSSFLLVQLSTSSETYSSTSLSSSSLLGMNRHIRKTYRHAHTLTSRPFRQIPLESNSATSKRTFPFDRLPESHGWQSIWKAACLMSAAHASHQCPNMQAPTRRSEGKRGAGEEKGPRSSCWSAWPPQQKGSCRSRSTTASLSWQWRWVCG